MQDFEAFFKTATGGHKPYDYQRRLACDGANGATCASRLISIPTGMGKTAAVTLAWLWNRVALGNNAWPRRLVYCLPMRTLVEQTRDEITRWLDNLTRKFPDNADLAWLSQRSPVVLMGGEENDKLRREWDIYPEKPAILIGTQDMLLSRALNRGYGMSRARWPMHFALLNNDCLWVMDETQLMDVGLATSAQLQSFRNPDAHTWWMSATLQPDWLRSPETAALLPSLIANILTTTPPSGISKQLSLQTASDERGIAALVTSANDSNQPPHTILVILNTVKRAIAVFEALSKNKAFPQSSDLHLVHSRFRPTDRKSWRDFLSRDTDTTRQRIIVATQVVEAGVDISADMLITDLAPWTSLIQRFGRAARYGGSAQVIVIDLDENKSVPYDYAELDAAREELRQLNDVSIESLTGHGATLSPERRAALYPYSPSFLLLRRELDELFDTSADLSGADIDVSRFIRSGEEHDCQIAWINSAPPDDFQPPSSELCSVPIGDAKKFVSDNKGSVWRWDYLDHDWRPAKPEEIYPGLILLALASTGGYAPHRGFDVSIKKPVPTIPPTVATATADSAEEDESLSETEWQTISEHGKRTAKILHSLGLDFSAVLELAARWHDIGKAHPAFQSLLKDAPAADIAKAPPSAWIKPPKYKTSDTDPRPGFRHELASALALLDLRSSQNWLSTLTPTDFDLLLYLVASHHGKVRASMQASPRDQEHPVAQTGAVMPIRGIIEGDIVRGAPFNLPDMVLTLTPASIGYSEKTGASWMERVALLLSKHGPLRLAFLENLLRSADARASQQDLSK